MYCPSCGSDERQPSQYCRVCGTDLRAVRLSLEQPDSITASAISARQQISLAIADRIRQVQKAKDLEHIAEDVLPQIEKFLESPEEKRLRRMRAGVVVASLGVGFTVLMLLMAGIARPSDLEGFIGGAGLGIVTFCIGLGLLLNALLFTRPRKGVADHSADGHSQQLIDAGYTPPPLRSPTTSNLIQPPNSVTDHTTLHLKSKR